MAQMIPRTRFYTDRTKIFDHFKEHFESFEEFSRLNAMSEYVGAEKYSDVCAGFKVSDHPYQLKDAVALGGLLFNLANALATRAALLFDFNHNE